MATRARPATQSSMPECAQLWATGWMHNRVRMIAASFLIKHLLIDWREGEQWFWDTLVDADYGFKRGQLAVDGGDGRGQQYVRPHHGAAYPVREIRCGGLYSRMGAGIGGVGTRLISMIRMSMGVRPKDYPKKIIGHREARERALAAYEEIKAQLIVVAPAKAERPQSSIRNLGLRFSLRGCRRLANTTLVTSTQPCPVSKSPAAIQQSRHPRPLVPSASRVFARIG